jgi:5-methylcytosine-specific restriction endonuclease McrA
MTRSFIPGTCINCDAPLVGGKPRLYCGDLCDQTAHTIRYARRVIADGRWQQDDVREAIRTQMAMILGGGYPARARALTTAERHAIIERDGGRCRLCDEPATEVDHIAGSSGDRANLQALCHNCHARKTALGFRPAEGAALLHAQAIWRRVMAPTPTRPCDDDIAWVSVWRTLLQRTKAEWVYEDDDGPGYGEGVPQSVEELEHSFYLKELAARDD